MKCFAVLSLLLGGAPLLAQEPPQPPPAPAVPEEGAEPQEPSPPSPEEVMAEIQELIEKVRQDFLAVDRRLEDTQEAVDQAPDPAPPLKEGLQGALEDADQLLADMEELLEKLPAADSNSSSSGGRDRQPRDQQDPRQLDDPRQGQPEEGREDPQEPQQEEGPRPPLEELNRLLFDLSPGAWGTLPVRLQEALQNANTEDLPPRYRRWIERYQRRPESPATRR